MVQVEQLPALLQTGVEGPPMLALRRIGAACDRHAADRIVESQLP